MTKLFKLTTSGEAGLNSFYVYQSEFYELEISFTSLSAVNGAIRVLKGDYIPQINVNRKTGEISIQTTSYGSLSPNEATTFVESYNIALSHVPEIEALIALYKAKIESGIIA